MLPVPDQRGTLSFESVASAAAFASVLYVGASVTFDPGVVQFGQHLIKNVVFASFSSKSFPMSPASFFLSSREILRSSLLSSFWSGTATARHYSRQVSPAPSLIKAVQSIRSKLKICRMSSARDLGASRAS